VARTLLLPLPATGADLVGIGDYDGNGSADLLWEMGGDLELWGLDGGVVIRTLALDRSTAPTAESWRVSGSGDFDGDDRDDLLLFSSMRGEAQIWTFDDAGVATRTRYPDIPGRWNPEVVAGAVSGGIAGIVWHDPLDRTLQLSTPAGDLIFLGEVGQGWSVVEATNLDGVGASELLLEDAVSGSLQAWRLGATGLEGMTEVPASPAGSTRASCGDFDGDGRGDLAWSDSASGRVTLRYGDTFAEQDVDRMLPEGATILRPEDHPDPEADYCSADLNGDGSANGADGRLLRACLRLGSTEDGCEGADLDGSGVLDTADLTIFKELSRGASCN
jgi:hypothetical protein